MNVWLRTLGLCAFLTWVGAQAQEAPRLLANINLQGDSAPKVFTQVGGTLLFTADDGAAGGTVPGRKLWRTDGTVDGTAPVMNDAAAGGGPAWDPEFFTRAEDLLYFIADDQAHGRELWRSDGTAAGTLLLADANWGPGDLNPTLLGTAAGNVFYLAGQSTVGQQTYGGTIWRTNGERSGTGLLMDTAAGRTYRNASLLTWVSGNLVFRADDAADTYALWVSDGTATGTRKAAGPCRYPVGIALVANEQGVTERQPVLSGEGDDQQAFFQGWHQSYGRELWLTDGTYAGTGLPRDINAGSADSDPISFAMHNGTLFFVADDGQRGHPIVPGRKLWRTQGTFASTKLVVDSGRAAGPLWNPVEFARIGDVLCFLAEDAAHGQELWRTDGTEAGTFLLGDLNQGSGWSYPVVEQQGADGGLTLSADHHQYGRVLYVVDADAEEAVLLMDVQAGRVYTAAKALHRAQAGLLFSATDGTHPNALWLSEASDPYYTGKYTAPDGRVCLNPQGIVVDGATVRGGRSAPEFFVEPSTGNTFFQGRHEVYGRELWCSDGTHAGTRFLGNTNPAGDSDPVYFATIGGVLLYQATDGAGGRSLWRSDGTPENTQPILDSAGGAVARAGSPSLLTQTATGVYFAATDSILGRQVWRTDGTAAGTVMLTASNMANGGSSLDPAVVAVAGETVYFSADNDQGVRVLWRAGGDQTGAVALLSGSPAYAYRDPLYFAEAGGALLFSAETASRDSLRALWGVTATGVPGPVTDARTGRPCLITQTGPIPGADTVLASVGGVLFFRASDGSSGYELWRTDGTAAGTYMLGDINAGADSGNPSLHSVHEETVFVTATAGTQTDTLWYTTPDSETVAPVLSGEGACRLPTDLGELTTTVILAAYDAQHGRELWVYDIPNVAPWIEPSPLPPQTTAEDTAVTFTVSAFDRHSSAEELTVDVIAADPSFLASATVQPTGTPGEHTVTLTPAADRNGTCDISVVAGDGVYTTASAFSLTVTAANDPPTDVTLTDDSVFEDTPGATVGTLVATDPDEGDTHVFSLVQDPTGKFEVVADTLKLREGETLDLATTPTVDLMVAATDAQGEEVEAVLTVQVKPLDSVTLDLQPGWNLLSFPFDVEAEGRGATPMSVFVDGAGERIRVIGSPWMWNAQGQSYLRLRGAFGATAGFWLYCAVATTVPTGEIKGLPGVDELSLESLAPGWNLVGPVRDLPVAQFGERDTVFWRYDHATRSYLRETDTLRRGMAYWILR